MSFNLLHRLAPSLASREMLFVGFEGNFDTSIRDFPHEDREYYFEIINEADEAFCWLEQRVCSLETYQLPYAVFCSLQWLNAGEFRFARLLKEHPDLCFVPLIAFARPAEYIDKEELIASGVDDCYTVPINWDILALRLDFLNQYKSRLIEPVEETMPLLRRLRLPLTKRIFDIVGASAGILLSSVLWLPLAVAIYIESRGPVIYKSKRVGSGYRVFDFLKFRSMYANADQQVCELQHLNQYNGGAAIFIKFAGDPRVTRIGRFIRKYSLDELPQLINVLRGEMSLVGNRPLPLYEAEQLTRDEWSARFLAPAGLTGLWQVTKRGAADMNAEDRIALDLAYARNYNLWTDLKIVLRTFRAIVQKEDV